MRRKIPSTAALVSFESAARHESFTKAAEELSLTQSAICRQIATLEEFLGVELFRRSRRGVKLTEAGLSYSRRVAVRLDAVERDTLAVMGHQGGGAIELAVVPTFGTQWLLPRNPVPVCSPELLGGRRTLSAEQVAGLPLMQQSTRPYAWRQWFHSQGLNVAHDMSGPRYELFSMLAQAAMHGMGVALIPPFLIQDELADGRLIVPMQHAYLSENAYYLIIPERRVESAMLNAFRDWLVEEARQYREANGLG
ncbi:LysR family transcriptional regulator [Pseudomonas aeruginosa 0C2E]|uniref:LysR substrate-binding domain-containing protein n=1 Tax=Pseudomonas aeruginosa TaxID=287 RepID=UPI00073FE389|nr:LysR substrate-binding domain-containing protein [Pseudomonas aeruginosa]KUI87433.1 LysR family transcriptional regulator [Pseudomonas aeruginosa 0C2E]